MKTDEHGLPTVIVPYPGAAPDLGTQDIFVYLRPETNGVLVESTILKVIKAANGQQHYLSLIFLANFPGEFIVENHVVEQYYALKLHFAVMGKSVFTEEMKQHFTRCFHIPFEEADIIGAFRALELLGKEPEELFDTWVSDQDVCLINGQCIKKIGTWYVVNYDIPALIHKNSKNTDIAVMVFRCKVPYGQVKLLVQEMHKALCSAGILNPRFDAARAFHYSKGPFEQILDGIAYLSAHRPMNLALQDFTYAKWLMDQGVDGSEICRVLMNPIVEIQHADGTVSEVNFLQHTQFDDYESGLRKYRSIIHRVEMIHHGPLIQHMIDSVTKDQVK